MAWGYCELQGSFTQKNVGGGRGVEGKEEKGKVKG